MKSIFNKFWVLTILVAGLTISSCSDVTELNVDPNSPTAVPASNLVTQAQFSLYNLMHSRGVNAEWSMLMVQHWSQNEYAEESRYLVDANSFNGTWTSFYASALNELSVARNLVANDGNLPDAIKTNQLAVIDIMVSDAFQSATDFWGSIPYSQAINPEFSNPEYDSQQSIYTALLAKLDAAVASIDASAGSFSSGDIIYNGDAASWKRFGASLLMRMAMRVSDADGALASEYVNKAAGHGVITSNAENALFAFDAANPDLSNPLYVDNVINNRDDFAVSDVLVNTLTDMGDPRLDVFSTVNNDGVHRGMPYGLTDAEAFALKSVTSRPSALVRSAGNPHVVMDHAEVAFMTAEAIERGFLSGDAAGAYAAGVTSSMNFWGIADGIDGYLAANPYSSGNWDEVIGTQKWIAFYMNGPQAWAEWRRLGYPELAVPAAASNPSIPVRLPYPISEDTNNGSSIDAVTSDINDLNTRVWWDVD